MRLLPVLFILTATEARRQRLKHDQVDINRRTGIHNVDVYSDTFRDSVDFGHVHKDWKEGSNVGMAQPGYLDPEIELQKEFNNINMKKSEAPAGFASPRDAILYYNKRMNGRTNNLRSPPQVNDTLRQSVYEEIKKKYPGPWSYKQERPPVEDIPSRRHYEDSDDKEAFFSKFGFNLVNNEENDLGNWTTCKEFANGALFHPDDVINIPWVPFFIWSTRRFLTSFIHTFTYPTKKLVKKYKEELGPYLNIKVNWSEPKLLLKESKEILLIAHDRKGLFYGIPYMELPSPAKNPYLAMMYCDERYATIMSVSGTEPETDEDKAAEAAVLKFQGVGNPSARDMDMEARMSKFDKERQRKEEESKYLHITRPDDTLDPSLW